MPPAASGNELVRIALGALVWTLAVGSEAQARPPAAFAGRPADLRAGLDARFWVWTDDAGVHLRWTTRGERRRFAGTLTSEGGAALSPVVGVSDRGQAWAPKVERGEDEVITFSAQCEGALAGLDLPPLTGRLTLALSLDGLPAPLHSIRFGVPGIRPRHNPFRLRPVELSQGGLDHHSHPHVAPHDRGAHHEHPHPHPHPPGLGHHHPR